MNILELKSRRVRLGLTQKDVADLLEITVSAYTKKENGQSNFTRKELSALKDLLELDNDEFVEIFFEKHGDMKSHFTRNIV